MPEEGYDKRDVGRANAKADLIGRKRLREGAADTVGTLTPNFERNFAVSLYVDQESEKRLLGVVDKTASIIEKYGGTVRRMGQDFPTHITLQNGRYFSEDATERDEKHRAMFVEALKNAEGKKLLGTDIEFKYLLQRPDGILLTATEIPPKVKALREALGDSAKRYGVKDANNPAKDLTLYANFMHITLVRFKSLPIDPQTLATLQKDLIALRHEISSNPIIVQADRIDYKNPYDPSWQPSAPSK